MNAPENVEGAVQENVRVSTVFSVCPNVSGGEAHVTIGLMK